MTQARSRVRGWIAITDALPPARRRLIGQWLTLGSVPRRRARPVDIDRLVAADLRQSNAPGGHKPPVGVTQRSA
jgi:hypothetical protein